MPNIREKLRTGNVGVVLAGILIVASAIYIWTSFRPVPHANPFNEFYTDDDGQTYFKDSAFKFPPFDHNGKTAVAAMVYTDGTHTYVAAMRRYTPATKKKLEDWYAQHDPPSTLLMMQTPAVFLDGSEVKQLYAEPKHWISASGMKMMAPPGPDGTYGDMVLP